MTVSKGMNGPTVSPSSPDVNRPLHRVSATRQGKKQLGNERGVSLALGSSSGNLVLRIPILNISKVAEDSVSLHEHCL